LAAITVGQSTLRYGFGNVTKLSGGQFVTLAIGAKRTDTRWERATKASDHLYLQSDFTLPSAATAALASSTTAESLLPGIAGATSDVGATAANLGNQLEQMTLNSFEWWLSST